MPSGQELFKFEPPQPIQGYPELHWAGKHPYNSTQYYPAQCKESHGKAKDGWMNRLYWGDNKQVMSHLLRELRGKIDLIYIDPPFDSKADYKKKIEIRGQKADSNSTSFEEKQYGDIWTNDEYLQFMYERLILLRELLSDTGSIYLHCDWHKGHHLRMVMDEVFGLGNFRNEIIWGYRTGGISKNLFARKHDNLLFYSKTEDYYFNTQYYRSYQQKKYNFKGVDDLWDEEKQLWYHNSICRDVWEDIYPIGTENSERLDYPTQKPEALLERIIKASSSPGDLVFDCFMGSGTTQAVTMKLNRRFIGADINLGAIQTTTKRLLGIVKKLNTKLESNDKYTGFEVYNVNDYNFFRNPLVAKDLLLEYFEVSPSPKSKYYDGEKDGRMIKVMPVDRICCRADLEGFLSALPYKTFQKKLVENPNDVTERITLYCMGYESDLQAALQKELSKYNVEVEVFDILRQKKDLELKRDSEADITIHKGKLIIKKFYPRNLMQKLSLQKTAVKDDWRVLAESVMVDFYYDGAVLHPTITDIPEKNELVKGEYPIPKDAGTIRVKITDLLSESLEKDI